MTQKTYVSILLLSLLIACSVARAGDVAVVVNKSVKVTEISADDLRDIYSGRKSTLRDGTRVVPVTLKEGASHEAFLKEYTGKTDSAFRATWRNLVFSGQAAMPKTFDSETALLDYVAATPGVIGYTGKSVKNDGVKSLAVK